MKFDYSKTINEQLPTFDYYKDRYCSYELELINDRKEIERLNNIINELERYINEEYIYDEVGMKIFDASTLQDKLQELKGSNDNG